MKIERGSVIINTLVDLEGWTSNLSTTDIKENFDV